MSDLVGNPEDKISHDAAHFEFQINEFVKFRTRLQNSLQYSCATAERMLLDLVLETNSHLSTEQMVMYMEINPEKG